MSGRAYSGGGGYAINLSNGAQVYVDGYKCNVSGSFYEGCDCTVYYTQYSNGNYDITSVDIYGGAYDGGWAGSNYYQNEYGYDGGYAGSNYYENEYGYVDPAYYAIDGYDPYADQGGYAGSSTVTCPNPICGMQVQSAYDTCPYCGTSLW